MCSSSLTIITRRCLAYATTRRLGRHRDHQLPRLQRCQGRSYLVRRGRELQLRSTSRDHLRSRCLVLRCYGGKYKLIIYLSFLFCLRTVQKPGFNFPSLNVPHQTAKDGVWWNFPSAPEKVVATVLQLPPYFSMF